MAVELCKISLWMEALEPGKPLSFLEHRIQCGNSLLGTTPALVQQGIPNEAFNPIEGDDKKVCQEYKKRNKEERKGLQSLFNPTGDVWSQREALPVCFLRLDAIEDDDLEGIRQKEESYDACLHSQSYQRGRLVADAWCAAFVWKKTREFPYPMTQEVFQQLRDHPAGVPEWMQTEIRRLAQEYQFFHWHVAFPDVFQVTEVARDIGALSGWDGGFDVVLANPPWERVKLQEKEWFASRVPEIANAPNAADRKRKIEGLADSDPFLYEAFLADRRRAEGESHFIRFSGRYPLCGRGDVNTYTVFAETMRLTIQTRGKVGCILPSGIATDDTTKYFFQDIMEKRSLLSLYDFENREGIFEGVHRSYKFCLLTLTGEGAPAKDGASFVFFAHKVEDLKDEERRFTLSAGDIALLNPNTRTCPIFRSKRDAELCKGIYRRVPILIKDGPPEENPWGIKFMTMFHMSNDSHLFRTREELESQGWDLEGNVFRRGDEKYLPLYEAKMLHQFDHRWATYENLETRELTLEEKQDISKTVFPRYWVGEGEVIERISFETQLDFKRPNCFIAFRGIARNSDERTAIFSTLPFGGLGNSAPLLIFSVSSAFEQCLFLANVNTFIFDYITRFGVGGMNLNLYIVKQLPVLPNYEYMRKLLGNRELKEWIVERVVELLYTNEELAQFALKCGYNIKPFRWDEERRFNIRSELDAIYFLMYGVSRENVAYIMDTFNIVRHKDEMAYGQFRTKRAILESYDRIKKAHKNWGEV